MTWTRKLVLALLAALVVAGSAVALSPKPQKVELGRVERGAMQVSVEAIGKTRVRARYVIAAPVSGHLARIQLQAGDTLQQGQPVARIAPFAPALLDARSRAEAEARVAVAVASRSEAETAVERARLARDQAQHELQRVRKLAESNAVAPELLDSAEFNARARAREVTSAEAALQSSRRGVDAARATLGRGTTGKPSLDTAIEAPSAGRVLRVLQQSEGPVQAGTPLIEMGDPGVLEVVADFLTTDAVRIQPGAVARLEQYGGVTPLQGRVRVVEPSAFTKVSALGVEEQRVNVVIDPAADPKDWNVLGDGYQVQARVVVWESDSALKVPLAALFRTGSSWKVFTLEAGSSVQRTIELGHRSATDAELLGGLSEGETVILHPSDKLESGSKVAPR